MHRPGDTVHTALGSLTVMHLLGRGKSGYAYRAEGGTGAVLYKRMHAEPNPFYRFDDNKVDLEVAAYQRLVDAGIPTPRLLDHNREAGYLVRTLYPQPTAAEVLAAGADPEPLLPALFAMATRLRDRGMNIDWFPTNFIAIGGELVYIDYETNPYDPHWSLEQWGLFYWANGEGLRRFLDTGDATAINADLDRGRPIMAPFRDRVAEWIAAYGE